MMQIQSENKSMKYGLIESNCQFLSVVYRLVTNEDYINRNKFKKAQQYLEQKCHRLNYQMYYRVYIEIAYIIYSSHYYNKQIQITQDDIRIELDMKFHIRIYYHIEQSRMLTNKITKIIDDLYDYLFKCHQKYQSWYNTENNSNDIEARKYFNLFQKQYYLLRQCAVKKGITNDKDYFLTLEQTLLFKEHSLLLKIKNASILNHIRQRKGNMALLKECRAKDLALLNEYTKSKNKSDYEGLMGAQKQIEQNILYFFRNLNVGTDKQEIINKSDKDQSFKIRFSYKIPDYIEDTFIDYLYTNYSNQTIQIQKQNVNKLKLFLQYYIQYSSNHNSICVRLMSTNNQINIQNSDFLMYQSSILTFESNNVNVELGDSKILDLQKTQNPKKLLAFKSASCLNIKEPPLEKILLLMDIIMISSKVYEPYFNPFKSPSLLRQHTRVQLLSHKVNHYSKMLLKCAKRTYSE